MAWLALKCGERQASLDPSEDWHVFKRHLFISCVFLCKPCPFLNFSFLLFVAVIDCLRHS